MAVGATPDRALEEGGETARVELGPFFEDADGDAIEYRALSSDPSVVETSVSGSVLTDAGARGLRVGGGDGDGRGPGRLDGVADGRAPPTARKPWGLDLRADYGARIPGGRLLTWSGSMSHSPAGPRFVLGAQIGGGGTPTVCETCRRD